MIFVDLAVTIDISEIKIHNPGIIRCGSIRCTGPEPRGRCLGEKSCIDCRIAPVRGNEASQFLDVGKPPIRVAAKIQRCTVCQCVSPCLIRCISLLPHQSRGIVRDGSIVVIGVITVIGRWNRSGFSSPNGPYIKPIGFIVGVNVAGVKMHEPCIVGVVCQCGARPMP